MQTTRLSQLNKNESGIICGVEAEVFLKRRLLELGFVNGTQVQIVTISPLKKTYLVRLQDYILALQKSSLDCVKVVINEQ